MIHDKRNSRLAVRVVERDYRTVLEVASMEGMAPGEVASRIVSDWAFVVRARRPPPERAPAPTDAQETGTCEGVSPQGGSL